MSNAWFQALHDGNAQLQQSRPQFGNTQVANQYADTRGKAQLLSSLPFGNLLAPLIFGKKMRGQQDRLDTQTRQRFNYAMDNNDQQGLAALLQNPNVNPGMQQLAMQKYNQLMQPQTQQEAERRIVQGADGFKYYADTGERVLPGVEIPEAAAKPDASPSDLRGEYREISKSFTKRQDGFRVVERAGARGSAVSDHALIFAYMKTQDPESVVRESEFEIAQALGSMPQRVAAAAQQYLNGERLTPEQRSDIVETSRSIYKTAAEEQMRLRGQYDQLAANYGYDPSKTFIDYLDPELYAKEVQPHVVPTPSQAFGTATGALGAAMGGAPAAPAAPATANDEAMALLDELIGP